MPEIILNTAGTCRTTGTADPVIIGGTGKSRLMSDLADGTEIAYYRRYKSAKAGFENAIGIWHPEVTSAGIGYIERTNIEASSNDDAPVVWGVGEQWIDVTANLSMLESLSLSELDPADTLDGTEKVYGLQGENGVAIEAQDITGNPMIISRGFSSKMSKTFIDFTKISENFYAVSPLSFAPVDLEPVEISLSGSGAECLNAGPLINFFNVLAVNTGTTTTGRVCLSLKGSPFPFASSSSNAYAAFTVTAPLALPAFGQDAVYQIGFFNSVPEPAIFGQGLGMFFELTSNSANWQAVWRSALGGAPNNRVVDTGIPCVAGAPYVLAVRFRASLSVPDKVTDYYINGSLVATLKHNLQDGIQIAMAEATELVPAVIVKKLSGTGSAGHFIINSYIEKPVLPLQAGLINP